MSARWTTAAPGSRFRLDKQSAPRDRWRGPGSVAPGKRCDADPTGAVPRKVDTRATYQEEARMGDQFPSFEVYLAANYGTWTDGGKCSACLQDAPRLTTGVHGVCEDYCEACVRYAWGYDQAEHHIVNGALGGAVKSLLEQEVDPGIIRTAVDAAIDNYRESEARSFGRMEASR